MDRGRRAHRDHPALWTHRGPGPAPVGRVRGDPPAPAKLLGAPLAGGSGPGGGLRAGDPVRRHPGPQAPCQLRAHQSGGGPGDLSAVRPHRRGFRHPCPLLASQPGADRVCPAPGGQVEAPRHPGGRGGHLCLLRRPGARGDLLQGPVRAVAACRDWQGPQDPAPAHVRPDAPRGRGRHRGGLSGHPVDRGDRPAPGVSLRPGAGGGRDHPGGAPAADQPGVTRASRMAGARAPDRAHHRPPAGAAEGDPQDPGAHPGHRGAHRRPAQCLGPAPGSGPGGGDQGADRDPGARGRLGPGGGSLPSAHEGASGGRRGAHGGERGRSGAAQARARRAGQSELRAHPGERPGARGHHPLGLRRPAGAGGPDPGWHPGPRLSGPGG